MQASLLAAIAQAFSINNKGPPAYMIIEAKLKPSEIDQFTKYASKVPSLVSRFGGEYVVLGGNHEPLEGDWDGTRVVLQRWPNATMAKSFWESEEYSEVKKLREGTGDFRVMLVEGLEKEDLPKDWKREQFYSSFVHQQLLRTF